MNGRTYEDTREALLDENAELQETVAYLEDEVERLAGEIERLQQVIATRPVTLMEEMNECQAHKAVLILCLIGLIGGWVTTVLLLAGGG